MKGKRIITGVFIAALVVVILLIILEAYYVAIALFVGALMLCCREIWSLIKKRKLPPVDERVRENINKSIRNGFIYLVVVLALLMLPFTVFFIETPKTAYLLSGLFISAGAVYLLSYYFYDRVEPGLSVRGLKVLRGFLTGTAVSLAVLIISIFMHNAIYALLRIWFGNDFWERTGVTDEPVFFILALISVVTFALGLIGSAVFYIKGLFSKVA